MVRAVAAALVAVLAGTVPPSAGAAGPRPHAGGESRVQSAGPAPQRALLDRYCVTCHNQRLQTGGLALDVADVSRVGEAPGVWEAVVLKLRGGMMPPAGRPRPAGAALDELRGWLEAELDRAAAAAVEPGRVPTHRLNRAETPTPFATSSPSTSTPRRCCRPTTPATGSTTSRARSPSRRR